ncbi:MAG: Lrp/AsnC family transcriptional regulator [Planktomarina sp.]
MLDDLDRRILRHMQADPDAPQAELAQLCDVTPARLSRRLDRLREAGVLLGQRAVVDWAALGFAVEVSLRFTLDKTDPRAFDHFIAEARKIPNVIAIQTFLGRVDVRLALVARDMAEYQRIYRDKILNLPQIAEIEALMHVATLKAEERLPL